MKRNEIGKRAMARQSGDSDARLGHTMILGHTGSGKTVFAASLVAPPKQHRGDDSGPDAANEEGEEPWPFM